SWAYLKLFFHSRRQANTSTAESSVALAYVRAEAATFSCSGRKKGLVSSSSPMVDGTVGKPCSRSFVAVFQRCCKAVFSGSTARAQRRFDNVYSWAQHTRVSSGNSLSLLSEFHIWPGVPSNSRPHPAANSVSPQNTSGVSLSL